jgi:hypothetical protein
MYVSGGNHLPHHAADVVVGVLIRMIGLPTVWLAECRKRVHSLAVQPMRRSLAPMADREQNRYSATRHVIVMKCALTERDGQIGQEL